MVLLLSFSANAAPTPDYSKLAAHPRLILKKGDIEAVREKIATDQPLSIMHSVMEERANGFISMEPTKRIMRGKRLLGCCRTVLEYINR